MAPCSVWVFSLDRYSVGLCEFVCKVHVASVLVPGVICGKEWQRSLTINKQMLRLIYSDKYIDTNQYIIHLYINILLLSLVTMELNRFLVAVKFANTPTCEQVLVTYQ